MTQHCLTPLLTTQALMALGHELIVEPARGVEGMAMQILEKFLERSKEDAPEMAEHFTALWKFMEIGLRESARKLVHDYNQARLPSHELKRPLAATMLCVNRC